MAPAVWIPCLRPYWRRGGQGVVGSLLRYRSWRCTAPTIESPLQHQPSHVLFNTLKAWGVRSAQEEPLRKLRPGELGAPWRTMAFPSCSVHPVRWAGVSSYGPLHEWIIGALGASNSGNGARVQALGFGRVWDSHLAEFAAFSSVLVTGIPQTMQRPLLQTPIQADNNYV